MEVQLEFGLWDLTPIAPVHGQLGFQVWDSTPVTPVHAHLSALYPQARWLGCLMAVWWHQVWSFVTDGSFIYLCVLRYLAY